jgi:hypothetical protein
MKQPEGLISVLLDVNADEADRDDAAIDLSGFNEPEAERALFLAASSPETSEMVCGSCGESLAEIWLRQGEINFEYYQKLCSPAVREIEAYINAEDPSLLHS